MCSARPAAAVHLKYNEMHPIAAIQERHSLRVDCLRGVVCCVRKQGDWIPRGRSFGLCNSRDYGQRQLAAGDARDRGEGLSRTELTC